MTNIVADPDVPPQILTFSLLAAPDGAGLNATNGIFSWRPAVAQAASTNLVTLKVADNGTPSLAATQSFWVTVNPLARPHLEALSWSNGVFGVRVSGDLGPDYRVQVGTNVANSAGWQTVFATNSPVLPFLWWDAVSTNTPARFYRVLLEP